VLSDVVEFLICPSCGADLGFHDLVVSCANGHSYDVARQGYVNLLGGRGHPGTADTAAMVAARERFFAAGYFDPLLDAVATQAQRMAGMRPAGCIIDLGAGPGHYLAAVLERLPGWVGLALDVSTYALRRAARSHPNVGAVACNVWQPLPVRAEAAALVLDVFAPRNAPEIRRVLQPGGALLTVTPTADHLREVVGPLGLLTVDEDKPDRVRRQFAGHLTLVRETPVTFPFTLDAAGVEALVSMGPSAWHVDPDRAPALPVPVDVTASVTLSEYRR
jgi:23S rRNA (guanine745-N1)-methyltransferase